MVRRELVSLVAGAAMTLTATTALAQQVSLDLIEVENEEMVVEKFDITVDKLEDMTVVGADGETIGDVDEVLMTLQGEITAVSVGVGGFLGIGEREVVVDLDDLTLADDRLVLNMTREQVDALPDWDD